LRKILFNLICKIYCVHIGLLTFINCYDVKETSKMQNVFMFAKVGALVIIITAGLVWFFIGMFLNNKSLTLELVEIG